MTNDMKHILSEKVRNQIDEWLKRYPADQKKAATMQALMFAQEDNQGWLSQEMMDGVADYLQIPRISAYEVASFYSMYNLEPVGRHVISVCTNISCMLNDAEKILHHLKQTLGVNINQTTSDGKFTLREVECLAACAGAPMFQIDKTYHEHLTLEKVDAILEGLE